MRVAFLIAAIIFGANYGRMLLMDSGSELALITSTAIFITIMVAKFLGATMPMLASKFKLDPATVAAPLITTIVDLLALVILFVTFLSFT
jgi:magnesium transporter